LVAGLAALAGFVVWWATGPWGPGLSPDAIAYSAVAEELRDHWVLGYWLEPRMSSWPPLFPLVLAAGSKVLDNSVIDVARATNAIMHGATVMLVAILAGRLLRSRWLWFMAVVTAALAQPLLMVSVKVWSEPLFNVLVLLAALVLSGAPGRRPMARMLALSAIVVAAFTTRYAGLVFVPAAAVVLVVWPRSCSVRERINRALLFGVPAGTAAMLLVAWNVRRTGEAFGPRWHPDEPPWTHLADGLAAIGQWWLPTGSPRVLGLVVGGAVAALAVYVLMVAGRTRATRSEGDASPSIGVQTVLAAFLVAYLAYMVWARSTSGFDPLNSRLMLPVFVPSLLLVLSLVDRWSETRPRGVSQSVVLVLPLLWVLPAVFGGLDGVRASHDIGNEYTNAAVRQFVASPVLGAIPDDCSLITNDPWLMWLTGRTAQLTPEQDREVAIPLSMELGELAPLVATEPTCLVWLETGSSVFFEPDDLATVVDLERLASDEFTTIYRLAPRS
jgi:hypothetical protein